MTIELTDEQRQALGGQSDEPVQVIDPRTKETYVLLRAELYERLRGCWRKKRKRRPNGRHGWSRNQGATCVGPGEPLLT